MLTFACPWLFLLVPLPWILKRFWRPHRESMTAVRVPFMSRLSQLTGQQPGSGAVILQRGMVQRVLLAVVWLCVLASAARPQVIEEPLTKVRPSRDMLLAVDLSSSMSAEDFENLDGERVDRLTAVKQVLSEFLARRQDDRVGLIFFGSAAYLQAPFTNDLDVCEELLDEATVGMAGPRTVVGDAIGLGITVFQRSEVEDRVMILLTDGNDTGSQIPPQQAAQIAADNKIRIHAVAVGDPQSVNEEKLDEETLKAVAKDTGGSYFRADNQSQLEGIYDELDKIETHEAETIEFSPKRDVFHWPLAAAFLISLISQLIEAIRHWSTASARLSAGGRFAFIMAVPGTAVGFAVTTMARSEPVVFTGFHFLRPWWLLLLIVAGFVLWMIIRQSDTRRAWESVIDSHLLNHLMTDSNGQRRLRPVHVMGVVWVMFAVAMAGPTWQREPAPFADDQAVMMIVVKCTPTMLAEDVQPSRLERTAQKIHDLLAQRKGARAALIAYAGSAHVVMPLTRDARIIEMFAGQLSPDIMPVEGAAADEAIMLALKRLEKAEQSGSIVLFADDVSEAETDRLLKAAGSAVPPVQVVAMAADADAVVPPDSPPAPPLNRNAMQDFASSTNGSVTYVTADNRDMQRVAGLVETGFVPVVSEEGGERWKDAGYWLTLPIALIVLFWFRPGWVIRWD